MNPPLLIRQICLVRPDSSLSKALDRRCMVFQVMLEAFKQVWFLHPFFHSLKLSSATIILPGSQIFQPSLILNFSLLLRQSTSHHTFKYFHGVLLLFLRVPRPSQASKIQILFPVPDHASWSWWSAPRWRDDGGGG